jgi:hypothetical protein
VNLAPFGQFCIHFIITQTKLEQGQCVSPARAQVSNYHISSALWGNAGRGIARVGVLAHESAHFLGTVPHNQYWFCWEMFGWRSPCTV